MADFTKTDHDRIWAGVNKIFSLWADKDAKSIQQSARDYVLHGKENAHAIHASDALAAKLPDDYLVSRSFVVPNVDYTYRGRHAIFYRGDRWNELLDDKNFAQYKTEIQGIIEKSKAILYDCNRIENNRDAVDEIRREIEEGYCRDLDYCYVKQEFQGRKGTFRIIRKEYILMGRYFQGARCDLPFHFPTGEKHDGNFGVLFAHKFWSKA